MPTYPVKNMKTGEEKELSMTMKDYDTWRKEIVTVMTTMNTGITYNPVLKYYDNTP